MHKGEVNSYNQRANHAGGRFLPMQAGPPRRPGALVTLYNGCSAPSRMQPLGRGCDSHESHMPRQLTQGLEWMTT